MRDKPAPKFIKRSHKLREWGMSRTTGWRREREDPLFPRPIHLGGTMFVYEVAACDQWERAMAARTSSAKSGQTR